MKNKDFNADKDAYFMRLMKIVDSMIDDFDQQLAKELTENPPPKSGDSAGGSQAPIEDLGDSLDGTLNANLHPCMLPFEDFVCDIGHKSHPYCD